MKTYLSLFAFCLIILSLASCSQYMSKTELDKKAIERKVLATITEPPKNYLPPEKYKPIKNILPNEQPISPKFLSKVSISFSESAPINKVLIEIAKQLGISIVVSSKIKSPVEFNAKDRQFIEVIADLCEMSKLRYKIKGSTVHIEPDKPYLKLYNLQFLSMARHGSSELSTTPDMFKSKNKKEDDNMTINGSNNTIKGETNVDFWQELEFTLNAIINANDPHGLQKPVSIHKQGGLMSITATERQHRLISTYINALKMTATSQVLIEAKIFEVTLNDKFKSGIDWQSGMSSQIIGVPTGASIQDASVNILSGDANLYTLGYTSKNISSILKFIEGFGSVRTLSNPRITVMNNQTAVLKVAKNEIFFQIKFTHNTKNETATTSRDYVTAESKMQAVPIGLIMAVQPAINLETGEVILTIRPTISRVVSVKKDPAISVLASQLTQNNTTDTAKLSSILNSICSEVPVVEVREIDSILKVQSGQGIIMGGLMQENTDRKNYGIPATDKMPVLSEITRGRSRTNDVTELVIFLRVHIVPNENITIDAADKRIFKSYSNDPRPIHFSGD